MERDGAKARMKMVPTRYAMNTIIVVRAPNLSCAHALIKRPASCPTCDEFERPDCQAGEMTFLPSLALYSPKWSWNWVRP